MIFPWTTEGDRFRIDEITDLHYIGTNLEEKKSKITGSILDLNRVTGDLYIVNRYTPKAMEIMVGLCGRKLQPPECKAKMEKLGGNEFDCFVISEQNCKSVLDGNNFQMRAGYSCRAAERRF